MIKDLTEELSLDDNIDDSDVLEEKKKVLEEDSAKNIPQNEMKISFPQVKLEIFFHDILEGPKLEINGIRENENRVLNNEKYGSQGILESLNREDGENENSVDCSSEKGCMYVQYTLSSKFSNTATIENNERNKIKSICKVDNNMKEVKWDDNDALCIVAVSGPESLVPGTPLYTYAEEPYELFEYTEQPRCLPGRSPSPPLHPLAGNTSSFSTFAKNDLHGYMRLPLPMHSGWFVVSYVRTYIAGIEESKTSDDNEKEERNENEKILVNTNITEETVKNNIPSIIIRKRIELGKSELFSIEVPVQGVGEDVLLPCNKGVRRRGAGYLGGPLWEGTVDSGFFDKQTFKDDKKNNNNDSNNGNSNDITECNYNADFNILSDNGIQDPRSLQSKHSIPLGKTVEMLDVTVEDLKSIKTLSLTISLPHIEQNKKFPNFDDNNESIDRSKNKNEDRNKNKYFVDRKFVKDDVCVDIDSQKSTESILCRAMIWAYDVNKEKEKEKIRFDSGKKIEKETHKNNNFHKSSYDINIADNDHKINYNSNNNNCNNYDDQNDNNDNNDNNDGDKIKQRTVLRIVVEADVITIHRNNGVVTVESVRTAYGILNINDDDDVIQSILNDSKFDHMNNNMPYPSSRKSRIIPLKLTGSTGSINRYGQFISRIFYGENSGGNLRLKDTVSPYSKREEILLPSSPKTVDQVKSNITDFMIISSTEINVEEKEENLNDDKKRNINKNTDINETTDTDINIDICCGFCDNRLVPLGAINKNLPMPTGEFDDVR